MIAAPRAVVGNSSHLPDAYAQARTVSAAVSRRRGMGVGMLAWTDKVDVASSHRNDDGQLATGHEPLDEVHGLLLGVCHDVHVGEERVAARVFQ